MTPKKIQIGCLAFRVEGEWRNAYWKPEQDNMGHAVKLAGVSLHAAQTPAVKSAFLDFGKVIFGAYIRDIFGVEVAFGAPETAPEHERAGRS